MVLGSFRRQASTTSSTRITSTVPSHRWMESAYPKEPSPLPWTRARSARAATAPWWRASMAPQSERAEGSVLFPSQT